VILLEEQVRDEISKKASQNIIYVKELFKNAADVVFREFKIGNLGAALVYIDGMADKDLLNDFLLQPMMNSIFLVIVI